MADIDLVIKIDEKDFEIMKHNIAVNNPLCPLNQEEMVAIVANGTPLPKKVEIEAVLSNIDRSMGYVLESDHRSFSNRETENGWLFDHIIEWRKMIRPYTKEDEE